MCTGPAPWARLFTELLSAEASKASATDTLDVLHTLTHLLLAGPLTHSLIRFKSYICAKHPGDAVRTQDCIPETLGSWLLTARHHWEAIEGTVLCFRAAPHHQK